MNLEETIDILKDTASSREGMIGLPTSRAQMNTLHILFSQFCEEADVRTVFAADKDWFRHRTLERIWGHPSLTVLDMAISSTMIDELGSKFGGEWQLTDRGRDLLYEIMAELEEQHPTQIELF